MTRRFIHPVALTALLILAAAPVAASPAQPTPRPAPAEATGRGLVKRIYHVDHLEPHDAVMIAHQICLAEAGEERCEYASQGPGWFSYTTLPAVQDRIAAALKERDVVAPTIDFRLALVVASDRPDDSGPPAVPLSEGEQRAMADLKSLFPYRSYRLLDAGRVRSSADASLTLGRYVARLHFQRNAAGQKPSLVIDRFNLFREAGATGKEGEAASGGRTVGVIDTSFSMDIGETVVVGTHGEAENNLALIVLLTARR